MTSTSHHDAPTSTTADVDDDPRPEPTPAQPRPSSRFWLLAPWVLAVLSLGAAAFSTWQWLGYQQAEADRAAIQAAASDFLLTLTNWNARDGLDDTVEQLRAAGSEQFLEEIDQLFGGTLRQELEQARAVSTGELQDVFVQSIDEREAVVFGVVIQRLESGVTEESNTTVRSARVALRQNGDRWLVSRVELIEDTSVATEAVEEDTP